jgi:hypothetical protein
MRKTITIIKQNLIWAFIIWVIIGLQSCKKNNDESVQPTVVFSFSAPDTLVFEHSSTKQLTVSV